MGLSGTWYNQLGSQMDLKVLKGKLSGSYVSAVGAAAGQKFELVGLTDTDEDPGQRNVGFVVSWENGNGSLDCVTTWSGQLQDVGGKERILTTWLLTLEWSPGAQWKSTLVGQDVFTREKPQIVIDELPSSEPRHELKRKPSAEIRKYSYRILSGDDTEIDASDIEATSPEEAAELLGNGDVIPGVGSKRVFIYDEKGNQLFGS